MGTISMMIMGSGFAAAAVGAVYISSGYGDQCSLMVIAIAVLYLAGEKRSNVRMA